ncbi:GAF domain-containing protein [Pseudonocardia sp. KRD-184]|uniref:GAF domain-containing protein n=1 Tax=Pseudonocardia oceani TaxID=2792013 RepID=A0ABS6U1X8_9PSEU|nr:histidine kinase [Pseudonocardia oceani]MBW0090232.1 GAF domain-containing protein [Pseudonocardia oceani]MBW0097436.1 GAF domain-containing protein [Pseudonocardia oceani]MBW0110097.1 GAF domain-containing protein [Pseudonocardia oceani]MBW0124195.1 GAF domain-containing protein [Pseudonocardia oceani]MBW0126242.1 GAF domain-containing protein [Pseudonocardia oceani]
MCYTVKSIDDVRSLVVATRGLSGLSDVPSLIAKACRRMFDLVGADMVAVALYDGADTLVVGASEGTAADLSGIRLPEGAGLGWRALQRSMPTTTGNCAADAEHLDDLVEALIPEDVRGLAAVPLTFNDNWLGVLYAGMRGRRVSPRTTLLMNEFGASLAPLLVTADRADRAGQMAVQEERQRIAQQLHDTAGQLLFQISMSAKEIQQCADADPETASEAARSIETAAADASTYLRAAMHSLLPADDALPVTMRRDVAVFSARTGITTELVTLGRPVHAGAEAEGVLVSALREGLHNVEKHAGAGAVLVSLAYRSHQLSLAIEDDGKGLPAGFDLHPVPGRDAGLGIPSLLQRVSGAGGVLRLDRNDDGGVSLRVTLPLVECA